MKLRMFTSRHMINRAVKFESTKVLKRDIVKVITPYYYFCTN